MALGMPAKARSRAKASRKKGAEAEALPEVAPQPDVPPRESAPLPPLAFSEPEVEFAARLPTPVPERARPGRRRAIFIDVENESRAARIEQSLETLQIDHTAAATEIIASGNWRVIAHETARLLARKGAQLVHSAPNVGVRDWSDLRIAVAAGVWLASAHSGDRLDILSADRAFDAVGDVAASLGVEFHRQGQREPARGEPAPRAAARAEPSRPRRRHRAGRGRRKSAPAVPPAAPPEISAVREEPAPTPVEAGARAEAAGPRGAAPEDEILLVVRALLEASPRGVTLDAIANRLKALGFERPPNSPRLVTRLRSMKELRVSPRGKVMLG
jgi:hypothetical protein